jgi:ABC-type transport system involved in multi-copper enzyme maturation permease subunit
MELIGAMVWKDIRSLIRDKKVVLAAVIMVFLFPAIMFPTKLIKNITVDTGLFLIAAVTMSAASYLFTWKSFSYEKSENATTNILSSPITVMEFFLGKSLAVFMAGYFMSFIALVVAYIYLTITMGHSPSGAAVFLALVTIPIWGLVAGEIVGALFLLLGGFEIVRYFGLLLVGIVVSFLQGSPGLPSALTILILTIAAFALAVIILLVFSRVSKVRLAR